MSIITFKGKTVHLAGERLQAGDRAPDFKVLATDLSEVSLSDSKEKTRLISVIPSIDTGVCEQQTRKFNEEASNLENVEVLTISVDLPFAQRRWCAASGIENVQTLSDHRDLDFGKKYGILIEEMRLLARAVFVVDANDKITYVEYVPEATDHVDYKKVLEHLAKSKS